MTELQDVHGTDWDYLVVLDACRYDIFEEVYDDYFEGKLSKRKSRGGATAEWLWKTFPNRTNYSYISANPFVNSYGMSLKESFKGCKKDWEPTRKFQRVIDAWEQKWKNQKGTVLPEDMTDIAIENKEEDKLIIHYIQPHRPYISCPEEENVWNAKERVSENEDEEKTVKRKIIDKTRTIWKPFFQKLPPRIRWKIKDVVGVQQTHFGELVQKIGEEKVRKHYKQDLKLALKEIKRLVEEVDGKVIITADHGELLGEKGGWGHKIGGTQKELKEVPWLEVEDSQND